MTTDTTTQPIKVAVPGFAVYAFPAGSLDDNIPYFNRNDAVGYADYFGDWPIAEIPQDMKDAYPGCDYISSPRTWQIDSSKLDPEMAQWLAARKS